MIANNTGGMRSIRYGTTIDHLLGLDLALATGEVLNLGPLDEKAYAAKSALRDREGSFIAVFRRIIEDNREEIEARFPQDPPQIGRLSARRVQRPVALEHGQDRLGQRGDVRPAARSQGEPGGGAAPDWAVRGPFLNPGRNLARRRPIVAKVPRRSNCSIGWSSTWPARTC